MASIDYVKFFIGKNLWKQFLQVVFHDWHRGFKNDSFT